MKALFDQMQPSDSDWALAKSIDPERLHQSLSLYYAQHLRPGGAIVLDTVEDPAYGYNHDVRRLAPAGASIDHLGEYPRGRHVWVVR